MEKIFIARALIQGFTVLDKLFGPVRSHLTIIILIIIIIITTTTTTAV